MPKILVDASRDEHVPFLLLTLYEMVEVGAGVYHSRGPRPLTHDQHRRSENQPRRVQGRREHAFCVPGEEVVVYESFSERHAVRDVVCFSVAG